MKRISVMLMIVTALFAGCSTASTDTPESPSVQESVLTTAEQESETMINEEEKVLAAYESMQQAMIDKDIDKLDRIVKDGTTFVQSKSSGYVFRSGLTTIKRQICAQN